MHITLLRTGKFSYNLSTKVHTFQISVSEIIIYACTVKPYDILEAKNP